MPSLCRECGTHFDTAPKDQRCSACSSPRLISHPELDTLSIAHIDCDAFYASVEKRDNPELKNKPVIVGGGKRGVVAACCYIARIKGVHSAMPMYRALKACPDAVVVRSSRSKYSQVGREIKELMRETTPLVESLISVAPKNCMAAVRRRLWLSWSNASKTRLVSLPQWASVTTSFWPKPHQIWISPAALP